MKNKKLINFLCLTGVISLAFYALHDIIGGLYYPDYNRIGQAVSDLTAVSAPSKGVADMFLSVYTPTGLLCCTLCAILIVDRGNRSIRLGVYLFTIMNWISGIGFSLFPLTDSGYVDTFQNIMHVYVLTIAVVVLSIASLVLIIIGGFRKKCFKSLAICALIALCCMFIGAIGTGVIPHEYFGIVERFSCYSAVAFNAVLGIFGYYNFFHLKNKG